MLRKHQLCQLLSLQNKIGNATETRKRAWEEDSACQLHPRFHSNTPVHDSTQKLQSIKYTCLYCGREIERDHFIRVQTWALLRRYMYIVFHLCDFVVDVHGKNYYHDCIVSYFRTLYNTVQISR